MVNQCNRFESKLREYLIDIQSDNRNKNAINVHRYNNLKLFMDKTKESAPHFFVRIGISEALFNIEKGEVINGSIGSDTKYVIRWIHKANIKEELLTAWNEYSNANIGTLLKEMHRES